MKLHTISVEDALRTLESSQQRGLTEAEASYRLSRFGLNELIEQGGRSALRLFWDQLRATMVVILIVAALIAGALGDYKNCMAILAIVMLYVTLGFIQEFRAERAIAALRKMSVPEVRILRDGALRSISARHLVPGDIVQLEAGNIVHADMRLVEAINLRIQEASLTGESEVVEKHTAPIPIPDVALGDRRNMAYMGTIITHGRGIGLVVSTGTRSTLGQIAKMIQSVQHTQTPLQRRLDRLGRNLAVIGVGVALLIFVMGLIRGGDLQQLLLTAVSIAVAIVPEGLPAVVTITLALGAQRMLQRRALIRRLPAVETLGSVTVICSDKTGTLTENRMTVVVLDVAEHALDLSEELDQSGSGRVLQGLGQPVQSSLSLTTIGGALCNDATLVDHGGDEYRAIGDPTEGALVVAAARMGYWKSSLEDQFPRVMEVPFDSERRRMTTVHHIGAGDAMLLAGVDTEGKQHIAFTKGGVDSLLNIASHVWANREAQPLNDAWRARIETAHERLAKKGMRVLGIGFHLIDALPHDGSAYVEEHIVLLGLFGIIDPPRSEVRDAITEAKQAGIRLIMITGDHPLTATEIARQLGVAEGGTTLTGVDIERLTPDELRDAVEEVSIFARVAPEHKLRIVQALQDRGDIVAMTGDGVNDAPALRKADIGVAMGITGTDVSKEASDLVLLDDNFATIVAAVREGRTIYENIRKFVRFSVAGNIGKVLVMLLAPIIGKPLPLLPLQLLWLNLLTDGLLGLGLGVEFPERDTMSRPPYAPTDGVFSHGAALGTCLTGLMIGGIALSVGSWYYFNGRTEWQTMTFTALAFMQMFQAGATRTERELIFTRGIFSNHLLTGMVLLVAALQLLVIYVGPMADFFGVIPLGGFDLLVAMATGPVVFLVMEGGKSIRAGKNRYTATTLYSHRQN